MYKHWSSQHATSNGFFFGSNLRFIGGRQSTVTMVFTRWPREELEHSEENVGVKLILQYFATGSDTASCQYYEEYEFVECLSEKTLIIDLFTRCKLQPHKLSQDTLATPDLVSVLASSVKNGN